MRITTSKGALIVVIRLEVLTTIAVSVPSMDATVVHGEISRAALQPHSFRRVVRAHEKVKDVNLARLPMDVEARNL